METMLNLGALAFVAISVFFFIVFIKEGMRTVDQINEQRAARERKLAEKGKEGGVSIS